MHVAKRITITIVARLHNSGLYC